MNVIQCMQPHSHTYHQLPANTIAYTIPNLNPQLQEIQ